MTICAECRNVIKPKWYNFWDRTRRCRQYPIDYTTGRRFLACWIINDKGNCKDFQRRPAREVWKIYDSPLTDYPEDAPGFQWVSKGEKGPGVGPSVRKKLEEEYETNCM